MEALTSFGEWVRRRRKALDLTQQELANRAGCSLTALQKIERDERRPSRQLAALLADQLQIAADQREQFIKVARGERMTETLPSTLEPASSPQAIASASSSRPPLPNPTTPLIGRENELETISRLLADPACRLVTLTGPGGVGKTRLALATAHHLQNEFADGVCFAQLVGVNAPEFIVPTLAEAVGFPFSGSIQPKVQLHNYLRDKRMLLVTDNFEHLLAGVEILNEILQHAPHIKLLATSREPLHLQAEWTFEVQGLPVPESNDRTSNSAGQLFLQRARQARVGFEVTAEDETAVAHICRLVGGMPLGIELAAAWVRVMPLQEIVREIQQDLHFLTSSARDVPERHRSLRTVFDYSWQLLTQEEQTVLSRLTVFQGGFTREAAEQVTGAKLSMLLALVEKSMVRRVQDGRFDLHELVRQYAAQRLTEPETILNAHAEAYLVLWCTYDASLPTSQRAKTREILIADLDNFRAAWDWSVTHKKFDFINHALHAVWGFHEINGTYSELTAQMGPVAEAAQANDAHLYGRARTYQAWAYLRQGQIIKAQSLLDEAIESLLPFQDPASLFEAYFFKGVSYIISGDWVSAQHWLAEARTQADASGNPRFIAQATVNYNGVLAILNNDEESFAHLRAALDRLLELDLVRAYLTALNTYTVQVAMRLKCLPDLYQPLTGSLALYEQSGDRWISAVTHSNLGTVLAAMGEMEEARSHVAQSLLLFKDLGSQADMAFTHLRYGRIEVVANDVAQAEHHLREAIRIGQSAQAYMAVAEAALDLANVWANDDKTAAKSFRLCLYLIGQPLARIDLRTKAEQLRTQLETRLTPEQIEFARMQANAQSLESFINEYVGQLFD